MEHTEHTRIVSQQSILSGVCNIKCPVKHIRTQNGSLGKVYMNYVFTDLIKSKCRAVKQNLETDRFLTMCLSLVRVEIII